jgi:prepilin-type N-terminal cleavage/methylation domain-containing protein
MTKHFRKKSAFTLVELAIVLTVIGLIIAGVVNGRSLIRQAQMRSVLSEYAAYDIAVLNFKNSYDQLPGDFDGAYTLWGTNCHSTASSCNGDGNWQLSSSGSRKEMFMSLRHLNLAGIIAVSYAGFSSAANSESSPGLNVPEGRFPNSEWNIGARDGTFLSSSINSALFSRNGISIGRHNTVQASTNEGSLFTPQEAGGVDAKIDDGMPASGKVNAIQGVLLSTSAYSTACFTPSSAAGSAATYTYSVTTPECTLDFSMSASNNFW